MKLKELLSFAKPVINPFKIVFQVFFQPEELENYLKQNPRVRKHIFWEHVAFVLSSYIIYVFIFCKGLGANWSERLYVGLMLYLFIYVLSVLIASASGGFFKRDNILSFIVGTYWSIIVGLWWSAIFYMGESKILGKDISSSLLFILALISICAVIINLYGRTRGIKPAFFLVFIISFLFIINVFKLNEKSNISLRENKETNQKYLMIDAGMPSVDFEGLFLVPYDWEKSYTFLFDLDPHNEVSFKIDPTEKDAYVQNDDLLGLHNNFDDVIARYYSSDQIVRLNNDKFLEIMYTEGKAFKVKLADQSWEKVIDGEYLYQAYMLKNDNIFLHTDYGSQVLDYRNGNTIWDKSSNRDQDPRWDKLDNYNNALVLKNDNIFLQNEQGFQVLDYKNGAEIWSNTDEDWYTTKDSFISDFILSDNVIYGVSFSGYIFAIRASDGVTIFKKPFSSIYTNKRCPLAYKNFAKLVGFYIITGTTVLSLGIYRIPVYIFEILLQFLSLMIISATRKNLPKAIRVSPLFFDHISTVPLPFSRQLMHRIAAEDSALYAEKIVYLLEKTHHQKLVAALFEEFHEQHQEYLFDYLYKTLQSENRQVLDGLTKQLQDNRPVGKLLHSYNQLLSTESRKFHPESHADILRDFAENKYRFAQELYLTYNVFHTFLGFQNLQEIAQADQALADILKISYGDLLNVPLIETFRVIEELSNDLKNYDVVENYRDKQYFLSEARIKLYDISRRAEEELHNPERTILLEIVEQWEGIIIAESKTLRGPAELEISMLSKTLAEAQEWSPVSVLVKNVGQSPAENVRISLLENENMLVLEDKKVLGLLGTGEAKQVEFSVQSQGNPDELRMYFDTVFDDFERKDKLRPFADIVTLSAEVEEFKKIPNPFVVGTPVRSEKVFFGRRGSQNFAVENLSSGRQNNVLIYFGQRRVGKSSILYRLMETKLKDEYVFVYIDCQGFGEVDTAKLLYQICRKIHTAARQNQIIIERPNLKKFKEHTFVELDEYLDTVEAALEQKHIALMFDEYEFLEYKVKDGNVSPEIFNKLRNLMQHRSKLAFIFAGTHRLTELTEDYWSILFNIALYREIGALNREAAKALITEPVKGYLRYDDLAIDKILRVTGLHPYFIQVICRLLVNHCNTQQVNFVTLATVNNILKDAVEGSTAHVKYLFKDYAADPEQEIMTFLSRVTDESKLFASVTEIENFAKENGFSYDRKQVMEVFTSLKNLYFHKICVDILNSPLSHLSDYAAI